MNARLVWARVARPPCHEPRIPIPNTLKAPNAIAAVFCPPVAFVCSHRFWSAAGSTGPAVFPPPDFCKPTHVTVYEKMYLYQLFPLKSHKCPSKYCVHQVCTTNVAAKVFVQPDWDSMSRSISSSNRRLRTHGLFDEIHLYFASNRFPSHSYELGCDGITLKSHIENSVSRINCLVWSLDVIFVTQSDGRRWNTMLLQS